MFDLLHLILTFFVGFSIAYYLFVWRNKAAPATQAALPPSAQAVTQPATAATTSPVPSTPSSPLPPQLSAPRIDISPASPAPVLKEDEVAPAPATPSTVSAEPVAPAAHPVAAEQPSGGSVRRVKKSSGNAVSTPSSPSGRSKLAVSSTAPPSSSKKAQSEDSVTPASSPFLRASAEETAANNSAVQISGQRRQSRSLNAIPKAANTKEAIKKLSSKTPPPVLGAVEPSPSLSHLKGKKHGSAIGPRTTVPATPVNLADWRRTGVSASHSVLLGSGGGRDADGGSNGAAHDLAMDGSASQQQPRRKIVSSSELPKHELQKGGSHRGLFVPRRLRSSSSTARKNATRVYPYQFDELSADLAELKKAFAHPITGVRTKTLTRKLTRKTYHHCFVGYDAVDWLLESVGGIDRRQAVNLGVRMWASGFFKHVGSKRPFSDGPNHFYFVVGDRDRKKRLSLKGSKRRRARRESVADLVMGEEKPIQDALKPREGWLDVKQGDTWTKHWCLVTEMRHIKARLDAHLGQVATGSDDDDGGKWAGWGLAIFEELVDKSLLDFVEEMTAAGTGIKIKARRHYLRNYGRCFAGSKAVDWCLANKKSASRPEAILAMTALLQKGLITHVDKEPVYKDTKHDYYKFNIPVGPGGGKEGEKEKKKEEKKEKKKKEKERRKEAREEVLGGDFSDGDAPAPPLGDITGGGGGKVATCPIAILPLSDCLIKLDKSGSYVEIVLYHNDNSRIFLSGWKPPSSLATAPSGSGAGASSSADEALTPGGGRRSWRGKGSAFDESASYFSIRIHRKDDAYVREWIFALEAAMLLGEMDQEGFTLDPTVVSDEDDEEDEEEDEDDEEVGEAAEEGYQAEAHGEAGEEVEELITEEEEEEEGGSDEAGETGDEEIDRSDEGESATEEETTERQEELMNSTEKIVLEEMRREIQQMEDRKRREAAAGGKPPAAPDDVDYSTVPDGELLKFLRARRLVVADAMVLMKSSVGYRRRNNLYDIKIADVMQEVGGCMLQLVEGALDKEGRVVLLVQPQHYTPAASPPLNVVRAVMYLLDKAQEDVEVQRKGFTVLVDGTGSKYSNFDPKMPRVLLDGIISRYPARIGYTIITNMPWFFRFVWAVIRPLLSEKLAQRFHIVTVDRLAEFIPPERLLPTYGGTLNYDHRAWIRRQHEREGIPYSG